MTPSPGLNTKTDLEKVINGDKFYDRKEGKIVDKAKGDTISGGPAVKEMLEKVDVDKELDKSLNDIQNAKDHEHLNKLNSKIRFLNGLKDTGKKPTDYMMDKVLVTPPKFRPIYAMGSDGTTIVSDENDLYQQLAYTAEGINETKKNFDENIKDESVKNTLLKDIRGQVYKDLKALQGLGEPTSYVHRTKNKKGFLSQIDGGKEKQTKEGFVQDKVMERRQDLVGRSTIVLNPTLGGDELGIPKEMADKIFRPFSMKKLVQNGYKPLDAKKEIENGTEAYKKARDSVANERLVIANRAPTLHKWNMTSFKPKLTDGKAIEVPGNVISENFGGDFDGDSIYGGVYISIDINEFLKNRKAAFGGIYKNYELYDVIKQAEVQVPSINKLLINENQKLLHINMEDFPRIDSSKKIKDNGNIEYDVPEGVYVYTIDNSSYEFKRNPVNKFSIHKNLNNYHVTFNNYQTAWLSEDQSAVAFDPISLKTVRVSPEDLREGLMVPQVKKANFVKNVKKKINFYNSIKGSQCKKKISLDRKFGWLIGAIIGDGWISNDSTKTSICSTNKNIGAKFEEIVNTLFQKEDSKICKSVVGEIIYYTKHSTNLAKNLKEMIGVKSDKKHLPPFYLSSPKKFKEGLLSGLLDTDGTVSLNTNRKDRVSANGTMSIKYTTISERLAYEISDLLKSLGVKNKISEGKRYNNKIPYYISISAEDMRNVKLDLSHKIKSELWSIFKKRNKSTASSHNKNDLVPFSLELYIKSHDIKVTKKLKRLLRNSYFNNQCNYITRSTAKKLIKSDKNSVLPEAWKDIVRNENITWVYAKEVVKNDYKIDMYDITAPDSYTFMMSNGIIVQDTFQIHTPVSNKALQEAYDYLPSKNMIKTGHSTTLNSPDMDMVAGTWLASKGEGGKKDPVELKDTDELEEKLKNKEVSLADKVKIDGKTSNAIFHKVNKDIPKEFQKWDVELDKKNVKNWISDVSIKKPNSNIGMKLANKLKDTGNEYITDYGLTLGVDDVLTNKEDRKKIIDQANKNINKNDSFSVIKNFAEAKKKGEDILKNKHPENSNIGIPIHSGAGKGIGNTADISFMPGILTDAEDKPISIPITQSYSEGLDPSEYWTAAHGARGGNIKKSVQAYKPGVFTKDMINTLFETRIKNEEPQDDKGIQYDIDDSKGVFNRFLAQDAKDSKGNVVAKRNELLDGDTINKIKQKGIKKVNVQSPLTDPTPGDGFSSYSYGKTEKDEMMKRGDNVGVMSAHTITEPALDLAMKAFHTGGKLEGDAKKKNMGSAFDVMDRVFRLTKNPPDKATLSRTDGKVKEIKEDPIGGKDIEIEDKDGNIEEHYVKDINTPTVNKGDNVKKGQFLSDGLPNPHEYLEQNGMEETQRFLTEKVSELNEDKIDKRNLETMVRGLTNTTKIMDPGNSNYIKGDTAPFSTVKNLNEKHGKNIKHEPFLVSTGVQNKASTSEDWIGRMTHSNLKEVFQDGTGMSWKSEPKVDEGNPMSYLASKDDK